MNHEEAIAILKNFQPLPPDDELDDEQLESYEKVWAYFMHHPHVDCIPLFFNAFGEGEASGMYQLIEDLMIKFSSSEVLPHLQEALIHGSPSIKYWSAQIAARFPAPELIEPLKNMLDSSYPKCRWAASRALASIHDPYIEDIFRSHLRNEQDIFVKDIMQNMLLNWKVNKPSV